MNIEFNITTHVKIDVSVIVVVAESRASMPNVPATDPSLCGYVGERSISVVSIEDIRAERCHEKVNRGRTNLSTSGLRASASPLIDGSRIRDEVLVISMGANQAVKHEVSGNLIRRMDLVVTDDLATAQTDSGDLIAACEAQIIRWEDVIPLEKIVAGGAPAPRPKKILFQSNGIADEDLAVGRYVLDQARRKKIRLKAVREI